MPKNNDPTPLINQAIALYGGTFDPIHYGHLRPVEALSGLIGLKEVVWLPNNIPLIALNRRHLLNNDLRWCDLLLSPILHLKWIPVNLRSQHLLILLRH